MFLYTKTHPKVCASENITRQVSVLLMSCFNSDKKLKFFLLVYMWVWVDPKNDFCVTELEQFLRVNNNNIYIWIKIELEIDYFFQKKISLLCKSRLIYSFFFLFSYTFHQVSPPSIRTSEWWSQKKEDQFFQKKWNNSVAVILNT
jgi:hypothetical protein